MTIDQTERLIVDLAAGLVPVRKLAPVSVRFTRWLAMSLVTAAAAAWLIGLRADVWHAVAAPTVLLSLGLAVAAFGSAAALALRLSIPGSNRSIGARALPGAIVAVWVGALALLARRAGLSWPGLMHEPFHTACVVRVVAIAVVPTILLARELRRGFALDAVSAAAFAALAGGALAAMTVQLICPIDRPAHLLVSHLLPVLGLVVAGALAARALRPSWN